MLERNAGPSEFGAGLQLSPNATRLLDTWGLAWGLSEAFRECVNVPRWSVARRWEDDTEIGLNTQNPDASEIYGTPIGKFIAKLPATSG